MALDLHQKIRAYLRQHGKKDMGGFCLDWVGGQTSIGRWDYQDVPRPTNDSLCAVEQHYLDYEISPMNTRDIYKAVIRNAPSGMDWVVFQLTEARRHDVTELSAPDAIHLSVDFWEVEIQGYATSAFTLQIKRDDDLIIYQQNCPVGRFMDPHFFYVESSTKIRVMARRINRESILNPDFFIVVGRI